MHETELQTRLRRATEALEFLQEKENEARRNLASAAESTKAARRRYHDLVEEDEAAEIARLRAESENQT